LQRAAADVISVDPLSAILSPRSQPKIGIPALIRLRSGAHAPHELCVFEIFAPGSHQTVGQRRLKDSSYDKFGRPRRTGGNEWTLSHRFFLFVYVATGLGLPPQRKRFFQRAKTPATSTRRPTSLSFGRLVYGVRLRSGERSFEPFLFLTRYGCTDPAKCVGCCISSP
jgi:hypothetical protein